MTIRRLIAISCALAMLSAMTACSEEAPSGKPSAPTQPSQEQQSVPANSPERTPPPAPETSKPSEPSSPTETTDEVLFSIQEILDDLQWPCAVAYLGYIEGPVGQGYNDWFEENGLLDTYPFLSDVSSARIIEQEGGEVYCIIPRNEQLSVTVLAQNFDYDGNVTAGEELFCSTDSLPFLIRGNISEIVPNTVVNIQYDDGSSIEFSPHLSGENGRLALGESQMILDISPFAGGYSYEFTAVDAIEALKLYETVQFQLSQGLTLLDWQETMEVDGIFYRIIAAGTGPADDFAAESYYAVSVTGEALCYDASGDAWIEVGFG